MTFVSTTQPEFVIWAPHHSRGIGGNIALHTLCSRLIDAGVSAAVWPADRPAPGQFHGITLIRKILGHAYRRLRAPYDTGEFANPIARPEHLPHAIVVYAEVVIGNPTNAPNVVRWFLNRPGRIVEEVSYGQNELYFFYMEAFDDPAINPDRDNLLRVTYIDPTYRRTNFGRRQGSCYLVRKGRGRMLDQHPADAVPVDGLSHEEMAAVFNRTEFLYTYDGYTLLTMYASLCGCTPIFLPEDGLTVEEWAPSGRIPGLAFGEAEKDWAVRTGPELIDKVERDLADEAAMLARFIAKCRARFG